MPQAKSPFFKKGEVLMKRYRWKKGIIFLLISILFFTSGIRDLEAYAAKSHERQVTGGALRPDNIVLQLSGNTRVSNQMLKMAQSYGVNLEIVLSNGLSWEIPVETINEEMGKNVDLGVQVRNNIIPDRLIQLLHQGLDDEDYMELRLQHQGNLGFKAMLKLPVPEVHKDKTASLFYYDEKEESLVLQEAGKVTENGIVVFQFSHASDYLVVFTKDKIEKQLVSVADEILEAEGEYVDIEIKETPQKSTGSAIVVMALVCLICVTAAVILLQKNAQKEYLDDDIDDYQEVTEKRKEIVFTANSRGRVKDYYDEEIDDYREKIPEREEISVIKTEIPGESEYYDEDIDDYCEKMEEN